MALAALDCLFFTDALFYSAARPSAHRHSMVPEGWQSKVRADLSHVFITVSIGDRGRFGKGITSHAGGMVFEALSYTGLCVSPRTCGK